MLSNTTCTKNSTFRKFETAPGRQFKIRLYCHHEISFKHRLHFVFQRIFLYQRQTTITQTKDGRQTPN